MQLERFARNETGYYFDRFKAEFLVFDDFGDLVQLSFNQLCVRLFHQFEYEVLLGGVPERG